MPYHLTTSSTEAAGWMPFDGEDSNCEACGRRFSVTDGEYHYHIATDGTKHCSFDCLIAHEETICECGRRREDCIFDDDPDEGQHGDR